MLLSTIEKLRKYVEASESDDEKLLLLLRAVSEDIVDRTGCSFDEYVLPDAATQDKPCTLPAKIELLCLDWCAIRWARDGSNHLKAESMGPIRNDFADDLPADMQRTLEKLRWKNWKGLT